MQSSSFSQIIEILDQDGVIVFPADTVWGLGCRVDRPAAIKKFYEIKKRELDKPTAVLVNSLAQAQLYGEFNPQALELAGKHWPGALTIIVAAKSTTPEEIQGTGQTVGLRWPDFELVEKLCQACGCGIMAGSANFAGAASPLSKDQLDPELIKLVDGVLDGECGGQPPSTVVKIVGNKIETVRQGQLLIQ